MRRSVRIVAALAIVAPSVVAMAAHASVPSANPPAAAIDTNPAHCDPIGGWQPGDGTHNCLLPFPNNYFTTPNEQSNTGEQVDLNPLAMPADSAGKPIDPTQWNRSDGFSVGAQLLVDVPGMTKNSDLAPSKLPQVDNIGSYARPDAGVVVIDARTGKRWPVWAELDQYTSEAGPTALPSGSVQQDLMIHPAKNFSAGTRYVVGLRGLKLDNGTTAQPNAAFAAYRDGTVPDTDPRVAGFDSIFRTLGKARVQRKNLYLAWDFTTASTQSTTGRLLSMRNDAFRRLGDTNLADGKVRGSAPTFNVTKVTPNPSPEIAKEIQGRFSVPCYIAPACVPVGEFLLRDGLYGTPRKIPGVTQHAKFICIIPDGQHLLRPSLYGHGLFGSASEVTAGNVEDMAAAHHMMECATNWYGMAEPDIPNAIADLGDLSNFNTLIDRVQQGELDFMFLARLMIHPEGFCSNPDFDRADGSCFINRTTAYYDGNSQGGIYGGVVCALIPDASRCVLGVPGEDYAVLLPRSSDYVATQPLAGAPTDPTAGFSYSTVFDTAYPDQSQRMLIIDLIQMLWDRGDPEGYASHMTKKPLPDTPPHHVLMQMAWGDHQVSNIEAETEARTIDAKLVTPALVTGRQGSWRDPFWGLKPVTGGRINGSALTVFDIGPVRTVDGVTYGTTPDTKSDVPNRAGVDPHEAPRATVCGQDQKSAFLKPDGIVTEPCDGPPYFGFNWDGVSD
jgi:hypothetical protein